MSYLSNKVKSKILEEAKNITDPDGFFEIIEKGIDEYNSQIKFKERIDSKNISKRIKNINELTNDLIRELKTKNNDRFIHMSLFDVHKYHKLDTQRGPDLKNYENFMLEFIQDLRLVELASRSINEAKSYQFLRKINPVDRLVYAFANAIDEHYKFTPHHSRLGIPVKILNILFKALRIDDSAEYHLKKYNAKRKRAAQMDWN